MAVISISPDGSSDLCWIWLDGWWSAATAEIRGDGNAQDVKERVEMKGER